MEKIVFAFGAAVLALSACKEKAPYIDFSPTVASVDTTYVVTPVPAAEPHNVLIENFTGASCTNCPAAHDIVHTLEAQYPDRINAISLFVLDFPQANPPEHAKYDFRTQVATDIEQAIYQSLLAMPVGGIDRMPVGQVLDSKPYQCYRNVWSSAVTDQIAMVDSINLGLTSIYSASDSTATIKVKVTYLQPMSTAQSISIAILEDGFVDVQEFPSSIDTAYEFNDVLRTMVTSGSSGDAFLASMPLKESGRVYERTYKYKINSAWNPAKCRVVAFVHKSVSLGGAVVYQSKQTKLVP